MLHRVLNERVRKVSAVLGKSEGAWGGLAFSTIQDLGFNEVLDHGQIRFARESLRAVHHSPRAWAEGCFYCTPDRLGRYDQGRHLHAHLPLTCAVCGEKSPNRLLFEQSHGVNFGASSTLGVMVCSSLSLRLNHLTYAVLHGELQYEADQLALGWLIGPDGTRLAPADWPTLRTPDPRGGATQSWQ